MTRRPRSRRPRQADVAALAGVSTAIVSAVINGRVDGTIRISPETQQRVWEAVRQLGYVANPVARSLAGGQNRLLGVFTYEALFPLQQQSFYYPFLVGIEEEAEAQDYNLLLCTRAGGPDGRRSIYKDGVNTLRLADGAILIGQNEQREELVRLLEEGFPFVFVGRRELPAGQLSYVAADYATATLEVIEHIVRFGHRFIAHYRLPEETESAEDREVGYRLAQQQLGLPAGSEFIRRLTPERISSEILGHDLSRGVTAIVTQSVALALRVREVAQMLGKRVPRDLSLAALGDPLDPDFVFPGITTFMIPRREMGAQAVHLLVELLRYPEPASPLRVTLPCTFVPGHTVAAPPA